LASLYATPAYSGFIELIVVSIVWYMSGRWSSHRFGQPYPGGAGSDSTWYRYLLRAAKGRVNE
jgi:hypothetical protein